MKVENCFRWSSHLKSVVYGIHEENYFINFLMFNVFKETNTKHTYFVKTHTYFIWKNVVKVIEEPFYQIKL